MYKQGERICTINEGSFWYVEILNSNSLGITCNVIGFQNKYIHTIKDNYFMKKESQFLNNYTTVTPDSEKEMIRVIYEIE